MSGRNRRPVNEKNIWKQRMYAKKAEAAANAAAAAAANQPATTATTTPIPTPSTTTTPATMSRGCGPSPPKPSCSRANGASSSGVPSVYPTVVPKSEDKGVGTSDGTQEGGDPLRVIRLTASLVDSSPRYRVTQHVQIQGKMIPVALQPMDERGGPPPTPTSNEEAVKLEQSHAAAHERLFASMGSALQERLVLRNAMDRLEATKVHLLHIVDQLGFHALNHMGPIPFSKPVADFVHTLKRLMVTGNPHVRPHSLFTELADSKRLREIGLEVFNICINLMRWMIYFGYKYPLDKENPGILSYQLMEILFTKSPASDFSIVEMFGISVNSEDGTDCDLSRMEFIPGAEHVFDTLADGITFAGEQWALTEPKASFPTLMPNLGAQKSMILRTCTLFAFEFVERYVLPEVEEGVEPTSDDRKICQLFGCCVRVVTFERFVPALLVDVTELIEQLYKEEMKGGRAPELSLFPLLSLIETGYSHKKGQWAPSVMQFSRKPLCPVILEKFADAFQKKESLSMESPLRTFVSRIDLPPVLAVPVLVLYGLESHMGVEGGRRKRWDKYLDIVSRPAFSKMFRYLPSIYERFAPNFPHVFQTFVDMALTFLKRMAIKGAVDEIQRFINGKHIADHKAEGAHSHSLGAGSKATKPAPVSPEAAIKETIFGVCLHGVQQGIEALEKLISSGKYTSSYFPDHELPNVSLIIKKLLTLTMKPLGEIRMNFLNIAFLDVLSEIGPGIISILDAELLRKLVGVVMEFRHEPSKPKTHSAEVVAHSGRTIGKLGSVDKILFDEEIMNLIFSEGFAIQLTQGRKNPPPVIIRTHWAWALAEIAQATETAVKTHGLQPSDQLLKHFLFYISVVIKGVVKTRYNGFRAAGNIFTILRPRDEAETEGIFAKARSIITEIVEQLGQGVDYKNRWNAAFGLGCIFENEELVESISSGTTSTNKNLKDVVIRTLAEWSRRSQNFKERAMCAAALGKINGRVVLGDNLGYVLAQLGKGLQVSPSDECRQNEKFRVEAVTTLFAIFALCGPTDVAVIQTNFHQYMDTFKEALLQMERKMSESRLDVVVKGKDRLEAIMREMGDPAAPILTELTSFLLSLVGEDDEDDVEDLEGGEGEELQELELDGICSELGALSLEAQEAEAAAKE